MRKATLLIVTAIIFASCLFADDTTDSATLNVSAYKETPIPSMNYTISIQDFNSSAISGVTTVIDISNKMKTSRTLTNAFTITIKSNLKTPIPVVIEFSPLINQEDAAAAPIPVTYTMTKGTLTEVVGDTRIKVNNNRYYYGYTPAIDLTGNATTVEVSENEVTTTLTHSIGTVRRSSYNGTNFNRYASTTTMPSQNSNVLPGFTNSQVLTSTAKFNLSIDENDYNNMAANMDYAATVKLTITSL